MRIERIETGDYRVRMSAYCGMSYDLETGLSLAQARHLTAKILRRRRRDGHPIAKLGTLAGRAVRGV